jgi:hypothetical protein
MGEGASEPAGLAPDPMQGATPAPEAAPPMPEPEPDEAGRQPASGVPPAPVAPPRPSGFRFIRLIADSDVTQGPLTAIAELDVLGPDGQPLAREGWVASADSAEQVWVGGAPASMAIDGDANTMWHTPWFQVVPPPHPHFLEIDLGSPRQVAGFRYLARQDGAPYGSISEFRFFVSADGVAWGESVASGTLVDSPLPQDILLGQ